MSLVLAPSNQHHLHMSDRNPPMMPGQAGYPVYFPSQPQSGETPSPSGYGSYELTSPQHTSNRQHGRYHYMGEFPPPMPQTMNSQTFASGANINATVAPPAKAYPIVESSSTFTPSNRLANSNATPTISPSQTQFNSHDASQFYDDDDPDAKGRCDSLYPKEEESPTTATPSSTRRRRSEYAEPGSARAIYLEKNRKAASKCRNKQKMEQEVLVERAREAERKNRIMKAELHLLQSELRDLKELAGQHANCPDQRIALYLQKQANRLASQLGMPPQ
jgi:cyclic AMP-dependent transcription factor ATF-2